MSKSIEYIKDLSGTNIRIGNYYTNTNIYTNIYVVEPNKDSQFTSKPPLVSLPHLDKSGKKLDNNIKLLNVSFHLLKTWEPYYNVDATNTITQKAPLPDMSSNKVTISQRIKTTTNLLLSIKNLFDDKTMPTIDKLATATMNMKVNNLALFGDVIPKYIEFLNNWKDKLAGTPSDKIDLNASIEIIQNKLNSLQHATEVNTMHKSMSSNTHGNVIATGTGNILSI